MKKLFALILVYVAIFLVASATLGKTVASIILGALFFITAFVCFIISLKKSEGSLIKRLYLLFIVIILANLILFVIKPDVFINLVKNFNL